MPNAYAILFVLTAHAFQDIDDAMSDRLAGISEQDNPIITAAAEAPNEMADSTTDIAIDITTMQPPADAATATSSIPQIIQQAHTAIVLLMPTVVLNVPPQGLNFSTQIQNATLKVQVPPGAWDARHRRTAAALTITAFAMPGVQALYDKETDVTHQPACQNIAIALGPDDFTASGDILLRMPCSTPCTSAMRLQGEALPPFTWRARRANLTEPNWIKLRQLGAFMASRTAAVDRDSALVIIASAAAALAMVLCYIGKRRRRRQNQTVAPEDIFFNIALEPTRPTPSRRYLI